MAKLIGKNVGDTIMEIYGPIDGRNYNTRGGVPIPPVINVHVHNGAGAIQLQETQTFVMKGNPGPNTFTHDRVADPATWVDIGPVIDAAAGLTAVTPTVDTVFTAIRAVVVVVGGAHVVIQSDWV